MPTDDTTPASGGDADAAAAPAERHGVPVTWSRGQEVLHPAIDGYHDLLGALFDEGYLVGVDLTCVDLLTHPGRALPDGVVPGRFEVVVNLLSHAARSRVRVRVQLVGDDPEVPTATDLYPGLEAAEREVHDLFGVRFAGHPDPTRIIMPEDWVGHPLRKDYNSGRIPVQFKAPAPTR
jgi:NADH-quinone oxidoreductase subunit C